MAIIVPWLFFGALLLAIIGAGRGGIRQGFVYAAVVYTLCLVFATEVFSLWNLLQIETLAVFYGALAILAAIYIRIYADRQVILQAGRGVYTRFLEFRAVLSAAGLMLAIVLLIAIIAPPNNWDSMTYHMSRVMMWLQQESVAHYPTEYTPQLLHPPLAEWNILHFQILSGGDRFANAVQWFSLFGCGVVASLMVKELKGAFPVQVLAAFIAVTLPMGVLQGSSTQNDVAVAFWVLTFTLLGIQYLKEPKLERLLLLGLALGFALLTKGTAYVIIPAIAIVLLVYGITRPNTRAVRVKLLSAVAVIAVMALVLNSGHYARNFTLFGHPLIHPGQDYSHTNGQMGPLVTYANLVRNSALHWGVPSYEMNLNTLRFVHSLFGERIDNIPGTTIGMPLYQYGIPFSLHEDTAGNFLHFWFAAISVPGIILLRKRLQFNATTVALAIAVILAVVCFSSVIGWLRFGSRFHTTLFMLAAPVASIFVSGLAARIFTPPPPSLKATAAAQAATKFRGKQR